LYNDREGDIIEAVAAAEMENSGAVQYRLVDGD
jgi:hypothetical protein